MRKLLLPLLLLLSSCNLSFADQISYPTTWGNGDTVTATKLNNNQNAVSGVVNGSLDNGNMKSGYSLFQTVSALPTAGSQGRVDFLTSDNSLNLDNGSSWLKTITPSGTTATGNIPYYNGGWQQLTPGAQYLPIVSNGTSSLPSYQALNLANGVTSQLPTANGGLGANASAWTAGDIVYLSSTGVVGHETITFHGVSYFASSGSFVAPTGITKVYLTMAAGGGAGKDSSPGTKGAGAGASVINFPYTVVAGNTYTVTVGTGGTHGSSPTAGGTTSFDSTIIVLGGVQGGSTGLGGTGGYNASGSTGGGYTIAGGNSTNNGSGGGGNPFGTGGTFAGSSPGGVPTANSGAGGANGDTSFNGSNGADGFVLVQY